MAALDHPVSAMPVGAGIAGLESAVGVVSFWESRPHAMKADLALGRWFAVLAGRARMGAV